MDQACVGRCGSPVLFPLHRFRFFKRLWPIVFQLAAQGAVGEHFPTCLTDRAICRFVLRIDNALNCRSAYRARETEAAMTAIPARKTVTFFSEGTRPLFADVFRSRLRGFFVLLGKDE